MESSLLVQISFGRCVVDPEFLSTFYRIFLAKDPRIRRFFTATNMENQRDLLKHGLTNVVMAARGSKVAVQVLERIRDTHSPEGMNIPSELYQHWRAALLEAVAHHDPLFTPSLGTCWEQVIDNGLAIIAPPVPRRNVGVGAVL